MYVPMTWEYYDVPYLYYKGYAAYLLDDNGEIQEELQVGKSDRYAYVRVYLPEGREGIGHIMVTYRKTMLQKVSYVVSGIAVAVLAVMLVRELLRKRQEQFELEFSANDNAESMQKCE